MKRQHLICAAFATAAVLTAGGVAAQAQTSALPHGVKSIRLAPGAGPLSVISAYGSIWVSTHRSSNLYRISPKTNRVVATIDVGQDSCGRLGAGFGQIWVGGCETGRGIVRVDAAKNVVVGVVPGLAAQVGFSPDSVWVPGLPGTKAVRRLDPATGKMRAVIPVSSNPCCIAYDGKSIWAAGADDGVISRIDPATNTVTDTLSVPLQDGWAYINFLGGAMWLGADAALLRVDLATKKIKPAAVHPGNAFITDRPAATGYHSVWWRLRPGVVVRLDPLTGKVTQRYRADALSGGGFVAVGFHAVWATNFGSDTVWRVPLRR